MKPTRFLLLVLLFLLTLAQGDALRAASSAENEPSHEELLKESIEALKQNTSAVKNLTEVLKSSSFTAGGTGVPGMAAGNVAAADIAVSDAEMKAILAALKWETNDTYKGFGSRDAKKGGTLTCVETSFPPTLRTVGKNANSTFTSMMTGICYESMLDLDPITYNYAPSLATRWAVADDKVTFYFELDERARWSDGKPVIASDIVKSWELYTDPGIEDPFSIDYWNKYEKPVAVSDRIVMVKSKQLNWRAFMSIGFMTVLPGHIIDKIDGKKYLEEYQFKLMPGSGPYTYESSKVNEEIILTRRKDWWQKDVERSTGYYNFDKLHFIFIQDENLVKEKFKKGEVDWMYVNVAREWHQEFIPAMMPQLANGWIQKRKVYTHRPIGTSGVAFNIRKPPFDDIRVRKAFAYLYNREKMMDKLFFNEYEYLDTFYPNSPYENPANPKIRFDPDKAVELLEEAGWLQKNRDAEGWLVKDGKRFELSLNYVQKTSERIYTIFQEDLRDVGIKLNLKQVTWATDIKEVGERNFEMSSRAYGGILFPNPESSMHSKFADLNNNNNIWGFKNKRVDEICDQYPMMFDPQERIKAVREIDGIACNEHLYALGWFAAHTRLLFWNKFGMPDYILAKTSDQNSIVSLWWYDEARDKALKEARAKNAKLEIGPEIVRWWDEHYPPTSGESK
ncbi:MAG: ABC transporter substrate-binding protein [Erysipelotrichia bacterium]|nr:ABC transporter substrate-binding protein [Erysipelotrichia bacterium]